jgi:CBS domain containing-hemolysin-like protein
VDENIYRLNGRLSVRSWRELFIGVLPETAVEGLAFDTLSGFIISSLGRLAVAGDEVEVRNLRLKVERVDQGRVESVLLYLNQRGHQR